MADCSYARCVQERRFIRRELSKWTKSMVFIVGEYNKHLFYIILFTYLSIFISYLSLYTYIYVQSVFIEETYVFSLLLHFLSSHPLSIYLCPVIAFMQCTTETHRVLRLELQQNKLWILCHLHYIYIYSLFHLFWIQLLSFYVIYFIFRFYLLHFHKPPPIHGILEQRKETRVCCVI